LEDQQPGLSKVTAVTGTAEWEPVLVVYPDMGNFFYETLARRLSIAATSILSDQDQIRLEPASALDEVDEDWLATSIALVVNPAECALSGPDGLKRLRVARRRIAVLADHVQTNWFAIQFDAGLEIDAIIDVGFVPQEHDHPSGVPYIFLYNAPLHDEADQIKKQVPGSRPLTWALVGHATSERAALADALLEDLGPRGFVFLPSLRPVRAHGGLLSPTALDRLLSATSCYVWCSHHRWAYYESFRFLDAMLAGAVPCKIEARHFDALAGVPNIYRSVEDLGEQLVEVGPESMFEAARQHYLAQGTLGEHLARALACV
jgi:hypothetical protein